MKHLLKAISIHFDMFDMPVKEILIDLGITAVLLLTIWLMLWTTPPDTLSQSKAPWKMAEVEGK